MDRSIELGALPGEFYKVTSRGGSYSFMIPTNFDGVIPGFSPSRNIAEARTFAGTSGGKNNQFPSEGNKTLWFLLRVFPNHAWDPKNRLPGKLANPLYKVADIIGQWNYGATAKALHLRKINILKGAGAAQNLQAFRMGGTDGLRENVRRNGQPSTGPPYGDDPWAQHYISLGYDAH